MEAPRHLVVATIVSNQITVAWHRSLGQGFPTQVITTGPSAREVRLAPLPDGVLVTWSEDSGLFFTVVDESNQTRFVQALSQERRERRGRVALASSPDGVLLMWPVLENDSVVLAGHVVTYLSAPGDGGADGGPPGDAGALDGGRVDAGSRDGGSLDGGRFDAGTLLDAGSFDGGADAGGELDGGSPDAGGAERMVFVPSCGCSSAGLSGATLAFVLFVIRRRRSTAH
jgi:hypothetical protein